ncbi:hypothetical protein D5R40_26835 [Okeania hirsuta]|uniref:Uncharacterized protein n=1 Tax=Okeania hirsuta TaxID=1458930 RepID=A0A3N6RF65_9CYAN|nr:hypothetical protein D5R40_26835 [Okeania hirsuta]
MKQVLTERAAYMQPTYAYACEGSGSETEGKCPSLQLDYVAQAEHAKDGHKLKPVLRIRNCCIAISAGGSLFPTKRQRSSRL